MNVDHQEIAKFEAIASRWWDPEGEFKPLHQLVITSYSIHYTKLYDELLQLTFDKPVRLERSERWLQLSEISLIQRFVTWQRQYKRLLRKHNLARDLRNWCLQQNPSQTAVTIQSELVMSYNFV